MLVANDPNITIKKCWQAGLLRGLGCRDSFTLVINLHFAVDTLIFEKVYPTQAMILKWSGLKINYLKSSLSFLGEVSHNSFLVSSVFNYLVEQLPIYLTWDSPLKWGSSRELSGDLSLIRYKKDWRVGRDIFSLSEGELLC